MPKLNISGLVNKCKELWKNLTEIKEIIEESFSEKQSLEPKDLKEDSKQTFSVIKKGKDSDGLSDEPVLNTDVADDNDDSEDPRFAMDALKELFSDYVGVSIVGFVSYKDSIRDLEARISPHRGFINLLADIEIEKNTLWLKLVNYDGKHNGWIKIKPSITAQVSEKNSNDEPEKMARYRIKFMGEDCIEYSDKDDVGEISYLPGSR